MWDSWIGLVLNICTDLEGSAIGGCVFMGFSGEKGRDSHFGSAPRYGFLDESLFTTMTQRKFSWESRCSMNGQSSRHVKISIGATHHQ